jgi:hypothetical protein
MSDEQDRRQIVLNGKSEAEEMNIDEISDFNN